MATHQICLRKSWTCFISDLKCEIRRTGKTGFRVEKVIQRKGDRLYVKWKGFDNLFKSWINMNDIV